jgi:hypothetical protein
LAVVLEGDNATSSKRSTSVADDAPYTNFPSLNVSPLLIAAIFVVSANADFFENYEDDRARVNQQSLRFGIVIAIPRFRSTFPRFRPTMLHIHELCMSSSANLIAHFFCKQTGATPQ